MHATLVPAPAVNLAAGMSWYGDSNSSAGDGPGTIPEHTADTTSPGTGHDGTSSESADARPARSTRLLAEADSGSP